MTATVRVLGAATPEEIARLRDRAMADYLTGHGDAVWTGMILLAADGG